MNIYESISSVMNDVGAIGKNTKNTQQGFMFRGIDAVMNALQPALIKNHIFVVPEVLEQTREERITEKGKTLIYSICRIKYTFYAEDGSNISAVVIGEGMDSGDKATNKAMSIAFKYACFQVFCIPTEEMKDPDEECHEVVPKVKAEVVKKTPKENDMVAGYPSKEEMLKIVKKHYPEGTDNLKALLKTFKAESIDSLTEEQIAVVYNKFGGR